MSYSSFWGIGVWGGQIALPSVSEVGQEVAATFVFAAALAAAVDFEGLAQQTRQRVGGHGVAIFAPFVPEAVVEAVQVVEQLDGEDALRMVVIREEH